MAGFTMIMFLTLVLAAASFWVIYLLITNFQPGSSKVQADIRKLRSEWNVLAPDLVPINKEELELLSVNQIDQSQKRGLVKKSKGVFTSIYHEPMIAYTYMQYASGRKNSVLYARTSEHEFIYRIRSKGVQVVANNQPIGVIKNDGVLYAARSGKVLGEIRDSQLELLPMIVNGREVAGLLKPGTTAKHNQRALQFVKDINEEEELVLMSLAVLELVQRERLGA